MSLPKILEICDQEGSNLRLHNCNECNREKDTLSSCFFYMTLYFISDESCISFVLHFLNILFVLSSMSHTELRSINIVVVLTNHCFLKCE